MSRRRPTTCVLALLLALSGCAPAADRTASPDRPPGSAATATLSPAASASTTPSTTPSMTPAATPAPFDPGAVTLELELVAELPGRALGVANAGDGSGRLFVVEQGGVVRIVRGGTVANEPFLDVTARTEAAGERGLLGLAFHPDFPADPRVFVDYTDVNGNTIVSSFDVDPANPDRALPDSEAVLLRIDQPFGNHNGGALVFGPDGYLFIATGDGGSGGDPHGNGQRLDTLLGKILRIDVDSAGGGAAYAVPPDNPFVGRAGVRPEIWLYGLRNPWRISFDGATGDLWIADVGQGSYEEIDVARANAGGGANYGWALMEGFHCYPSGEGCARPDLTLPVAEYGHDQGCAVTGGEVYRGAAFPVLVGGYVFADYCSGLTWVIDAAADGRQEPRLVYQSGHNLAGFGADEAGELYAADLGGALLRVVLPAR